MKQWRTYRTIAKILLWIAGLSIVALLLSMFGCGQMKSVLQPTRFGKDEVNPTAMLMCAEESDAVATGLWLQLGLNPGQSYKSALENEIAGERKSPVKGPEIMCFRGERELADESVPGKINIKMPGDKEYPYPTMGHRWCAGFVRSDFCPKVGGNRMKCWTPYRILNGYLFPDWRSQKELMERYDINFRSMTMFENKFEIMRYVPRKEEQAAYFE